MRYLLSPEVAWSALVVLGALLIAFGVYQRRLSRHHGPSRQEFVAVFAEAGVPEEVSSAVYDYYQRSAVSGQFAVGPDDDYDQVLAEGDEDIDDDASFLIRKLGLKQPSGDQVRAGTQIRTIGDMVRWLDWVRQNQQTSA